MTKKHFIAIAQRFRRLVERAGDNPDTLRGVRLSVDAFADTAAEMNPHFNSQTFYSACGLDVGD